jgi:hypothetical protein
MVRRGIYCDRRGRSGLIERAAGVGAAYQFTKDATSNLRQKDDCYSEAIAGFVGGMGIGIYSAHTSLIARNHLTPSRAKPSIHARCWCDYRGRHVRIPLHQRLQGHHISRDGRGGGRAEGERKEVP